MEEEGWISSFRGVSENDRRAKYYRSSKGVIRSGSQADMECGDLSCSLYASLDDCISFSTARRHESAFLRSEGADGH